MERDVIESVPALDGAHGAIERPVGTQEVLPARELEDESFETLHPECGVHEVKLGEEIKKERTSNAARIVR